MKCNNTDRQTATLGVILVFFDLGGMLACKISSFTSAGKSRCSSR